MKPIFSIVWAWFALGSAAGLCQMKRLPDVAKLHPVAPYEVSPQYLAGIARHDDAIWGTLYLKGNVYAKFHPERKRWVEHPVPKAQSLGSGGGACITGGKLWIASTDGMSISRHDLPSMKRERHFTYPRYSAASQSFGGLAHDGEQLWAEWHTHGKDTPKGPGQLLLKLSPENGEILASHPTPLGDRSDTARGLEWDGSVLWLAYEKSLTAIDPRTGRPVKTIPIPALHRPSGLAWDGHGLWIGEFTGKMWRLPFHPEPKRK